MSARPAAALLCALMLALATLPARAVELTLSTASVTAAVADGRGMAARGEGYTIGAYLLFSVDDALRVISDEQTIEAVAVGTPYERLRFHAYLLAHQGRPAVPAEEAHFLSTGRGMLEFVVFVHSRAATDREFMQHFGGGTLESGGTSHDAVAVSSTEPAIDSYYRPDGTVVKRWLGQVTYRFDLRADPYERADVTSNTYYDWLLDHAFLLVPAQDYVAKFLMTFKDYPQRQKASSFNLDEVMQKLKESGGSK